MKYLARFVLLIMIMGLLWSCNNDTSAPLENLSSGRDSERSGNFLKSMEVAQYEITLENLTPATGPGASQPLSPPILVTHRPPLRLFKLNSFASEELRYIAEDAVNAPMLSLLGQSNDVFDVVVGGLILPGTSATDTIIAKRGYHKLSIVTMLVNTNDAFTGVDKLNLPKNGSQEYYLRSYDAGTELNTEDDDHIPGPCCGNAMVRVPTHERIQYHEGIQGIGDLDPQTYGWNEPVAKLTITRINGGALGAFSKGGFVHGIIINVDGDDYYLAGAPDGPNGATDIPGHYWNQASPNQLVAKHFNTGPFGAPQWWSSDADDGELLYIVHAIIDTWSMGKAENYASRGYIHYHELVKVSDGSLHPIKVVWLKHIARATFTLDGGPHPEFTHQVTPGIDYEFIPNGDQPYNP